MPDPTSNSLPSSERFDELVAELRERARADVHVLDLLAFAAQELGGIDPDLDSVVPIGPQKSSSVLRLALIHYFDLAFGIVPDGLNAMKCVLHSLSRDGETYTTTNAEEVLEIERLIRRSLEL